MCWKDGFSIKWLANFSSSMANPQYLYKPKCALKTLYKMAFRSLQNGSFWCPKNLMSSTKNGKTFSNALLTTEWHPRPFLFPQNGHLYRGQPHPEMARGFYEPGRNVVENSVLWPTQRKTTVCQGKWW